MKTKVGEGEKTVTFHEWYNTQILPHLYQEQQLYERESVAFSAIDRLKRDEILQIFESMSDSELKLALFDHVRSSMQEKWVPGGEPGDFDGEYSS
jgi:hypothetical protein